MDMAFDDRAAETDAALLARFASGDARAARLLLDRLAPRVLAHALRLLGDRAEAEDVTQEAMLRLWRIADQWRDEGAQVSTWLYRVAGNLCIDRLRARRPSVEIDEAGPLATGEAGAEDGLMQASRSRALAEGLAALPPRQRQAVVLRHIDGLGNPEIAEVMEIGVEAVESLIARGRRGLAAALGNRREELGYDG